MAEAPMWIWTMQDPQVTIHVAPSPNRARGDVFIGLGTPAGDGLSIWMRAEQTSALRQALDAIDAYNAAHSENPDGLVVHPY